MCAPPADRKYSFSALESFAHCPMMYRLKYIDRVPDQDNAFGQYGTWCHRLLEQYEKGEIPLIALAEEYKDGYDGAVTRSFPPFPRGMGEKYYQQGLAYFESFQGFGDQYEVLAVEERFELTIGEFQFVGVVDLVLQDKKTGDITVIDHKSKSSNTMHKDLPTFRRQLYVYAAFVKQRFGVWPKYLKFNLFRENEWVTETFDLEEYEQTMKWVVETIENILFETEWKVCPSSYFCRFVCGVADSCPALNAVLNPLPKAPKQAQPHESENRNASD